LDSIVSLPERVETLNWGGLKIIQNATAPCFCLDAVLLADFALPVIKQQASPYVLDLGTGTGILPLLLYTVNQKAKFWAVEIMEQMADMAQRSVALNGIGEDQVKVIHADLRDSDQLFKPRSFDLVTANPPYFALKDGRLSENPLFAAARSELYCKPEDVIRQSSVLLKENGSLLLCYKPQRLNNLLILLQEHGLYPIRLRMVHSMIDNDAVLFLLQAQKKKQGSLTVMPPLIIYREVGIYTQEMQKIHEGEYV